MAVSSSTEQLNTKQNNLCQSPHEIQSARSVSLAHDVYMRLCSVLEPSFLSCQFSLFLIIPPHPKAATQPTALPTTQVATRLLKSQLAGYLCPSSEEAHCLCPGTLKYAHRRPGIGKCNSFIPIKWGCS